MHFHRFTYRLCLSSLSNLYIGSIHSGGLQYLPRHPRRFPMRLWSHSGGL